MDSSLDRTDSFVEAMVAATRSRATSAGVDPSQYDVITASISALDEWLPAFAAGAEEHLACAEQAVAQGRTVTAAAAYRAAALCWHFATCIPQPDADAHLAAARRAGDALWRATSLLEPDAARIDAADREPRLVGMLRHPAGVARAPVVLILPGLDSSAVEFVGLVDELLARGLAVFSFDGPGQGELAHVTPPCPEYERVVALALDLLAERNDVDTGQTGAIGLSLGHFFVARAAAYEPRLRAAVAVTGPYSWTDWNALAPPIQNTLTLRAGSLEAAQQLTSRIDLTRVADRITIPLLAIGGENDPVTPAEESRRLVRDVDQGEMVSLKNGEHLGSNVMWRWRPHAADWLAAHLHVQR